MSKRIEEIRGNLRIYDNRVAERDVMYLLKRGELLEKALRHVAERFDGDDMSRMPCYCFDRKNGDYAEHDSWCAEARKALEDSDA